mmetsp:Transcript_12605/g.20540  ORF Transcript_12605/g.20540 Transcript_12605/m.20540 type:complete len:91 (-) Transcript_12605:557-829(-)
MCDVLSSHHLTIISELDMIAFPTHVSIINSTSTHLSCGSVTSALISDSRPHHLNGPLSIIAGAFCSIRGIVASSHNERRVGRAPSAAPVS